MVEKYLKEVMKMEREKICEQYTEEIKNNGWSLADIEVLTPEIKHGFAICMVPYLNVRREPIQNSTVIGTLQKGNKFRIKNETEEFYEIASHSNSASGGFVMKKYCERV